MSQFTPEQLRQLEELLGRQFSERINPLRREPLGYENGRPFYGILMGGDQGGGTRRIFDANDPSLDDPNSRWAGTGRPIPLGGGRNSFTGQDPAREGAAADANADDIRYDTVLGMHRDARNLAQGQFNETGQLMQALRGNLSGQLNQAGQEFANAHGDIDRGYTQAQAEIQGQGQTARRDILDRERRSLGATANQMRGAGLGNTTIVQNAGRAIRGDTNRDLGALYEGMAGLRAGVAERGGQARAGARTNLANFSANRASQEYGAGQDLTNFMRDRTGQETGLLLRGTEPIQRRSDLYHALQMARIAAAGNGGGGGGSAAGILGGLGDLLGGIGGLFGGI